MIDWDKPVQTRNGGEACVHTTSGKNPLYPIVGELTDDDGTWRPYMWTKDGHAYDNRTYVMDLVNVPQEHTVHISFYKGSTGLAISSGCHDTRRLADEAAHHNRLACIVVTFTEGEGLAETDTSE